MEHGMWTEKDVANQVLRLLRRISELEAAELERRSAEAVMCQVAARRHLGRRFDGAEFAALVVEAPGAGVLGVN